MTKTLSFAALLFVAFMPSSVCAQNPTWSNWYLPNSCLKGIHARLKLNGPYEFKPGSYLWTFSIFNGYTQTVHFDINLLSPQGYEALQSGQRKGLDGVVGRMTIQPNQQVDWGGFDILIRTNTKVYIYIRNVRFGEDDAPGPYAKDECGHNTSDDNNTSVNGSAPGDRSPSDVATPQTGPYNFVTRKDGVAIYLAWITMGGNILGTDIKVTNENGFPVLVTWPRKKWYDNGTYINIFAHPDLSINEFGYSDLFAPGESKDAKGHTPGDSGSEVYQFRPNWLHYDAPKGVWKPGQLSLQLIDIQVLNTNGTPLTGNSSMVQNTQTKSDVPATSITVHPATENPQYQNNNNATNLQQQAYQHQANNYVAAANQSSDNIQRSMNLGLAAINATAAGNKAQVQQIQQQQQAQQQSTAGALSDAAGQLTALLTKPKPVQQSNAGQQEDISKSIQRENEARGDVYDANGHFVSSTETRARDAYDQQHADDYRENFRKLGKYAQPTHIDLTADMLKLQDNRSQRETMDFLARTIWQFSKTSEFRPHVFVSNIIDEIAFADSVFYYKCHSLVTDEPAKLDPETHSIDFNQTHITSFEITPGDKVSHEDLFLTVKTSNPKEGLEFHLTADAASKDIPTQIIGALIHLIILCHGPAPVK